MTLLVVPPLPGNGLVMPVTVTRSRLVSPPSRAVRGVTVAGFEDGCGRGRHPSCSVRHGSERRSQLWCGMGETETTWVRGGVVKYGA